jgi:hypothetical protein
VMPQAGWSGRDHPAFVSACALRENSFFAADKKEANGCSARCCKPGEIQALRARQKTLHVEFRGLEVGLQSRGSDGALVPVDCPICLDVVDENDPGTPGAGRPFLLRISRCGHVFHEECLRDALRCRRRCPKCRGCITEDDREDIPRGPRVPRLRARPRSPRPTTRATAGSWVDETSSSVGSRSAVPQQALQVVRSYIVSKQWVVLVPMYTLPPAMNMYIGSRPRSVTW